MRELRALVVGIVLGGVLFMTLDGGFRLGMRLVMLGFVVVDLRGGGERECWTGSDLWQDGNTLRISMRLPLVNLFV
jgi:hypothetical protein